MPFSTRITVRFGDTDPAGLVYYPNIFHYFHIALEEFFAARCGITYARLMSDERIGFPTVKTETEFFAPLLYGDEVDLEVYVSRTGNSSATFEYAARRAADGMLCARSRQVHVAMNLDTRRPVTISEKYRRAFEQSAL
ncbi:MAG TPA: thioesterase family protein [Pyrinomonadaceae bacterium]|nr:thioesterase family protein [Pyrinomonadaceae bacterium]